MALLNRSTVGKRKISKRRGRPERYSKKIATHICEQLMIGRALVDICKEPGIPSVATIYGWLNKGRNTYKEEFLKSYIEAREIQAEVLADQILSISDNKTQDYYIKETVNKNGKKSSVRVLKEDHIRSKKLQIESRKWLAAHLLPRKFSDRMQITGADGKDLVPSVPTKVVFNLIKKEENDNSDNS